MGEQDFAAAVGCGCVTPGPVLITATFIGYRVGGLAGAIAATLGIFLLPWFFAAVMMALLLGMKTWHWFAGTGPPSPEFDNQFTLRQVSIFFTAYVFFQVWNEINCRSLVPDVSGIQGLARNPIFLAVVGVIVAGQVLIVSLGGTVFQVEPLGVVDWLAIAALTASVLVFAEVTRRLRSAFREFERTKVRRTSSCRLPRQVEQSC